MISLGNPWGLLGLLAIPLLLLLHGLRSRRTTLVVPTTMLWESVLREHRPESGVRGRRPNLRLWLLLLFVVLVAIALSQPRRTMPGIVGENVVVILDTSASMKAVNPLVSNGQSRFAMGQARVRWLIDRLPTGAGMLLMTSAGTASVHSGFIVNKAELHPIVDALFPNDEVGRPRTALALARRFLVGRPNRRIYWITDAAGAEKLGDAGSDVERIVVGDSAPEAVANVGITAFEVRADVSGPAQFQALVQVANFGPRSVQAPVDIIGDEQALVRVSVELSPGESETLLVDFESIGVRVVRAVVTHRDALAADNIGYAVLSSPAGLRLRLVTPGNGFLERALRSLTGVQLTVVADLADEPDGSGYDLTVYDGVALGTLPPGRSLLVNTLPADWGELTGPDFVSPAIVGSAKGPLMRNVGLGAVRIERALGLLRSLVDNAPQNGSLSIPGLQPLFWSDHAILSFALAAPTRRAVYLGFDLEASNFPLLPSFPVFVDQAVRWLVDEQQAGEPTSVRAGTPVVVTRPGELSAPSDLVVARPDGLVHRETVTDVGARFTQTNVAGIYNFRFGQRGGSFAVNLSDADESNLLPPRQSPSIGAEKETVAGSETRPETATDRSLWALFAAVALLALALEWALMARRELA